MDFLKNLPLVRAGTPAHPGTLAHPGRSGRWRAGTLAHPGRSAHRRAGTPAHPGTPAHRRAGIWCDVRTLIVRRGADQGCNSSLPLVARLARARCASAACSSG